MIVLPTNATFQNVQEVRAAWEHPRLGQLAPPDFGLQWIGDPPKPPDHRLWEDRYLGVLGWGALTSIVALVAAILWTVVP